MNLHIRGSHGGTLLRQENKNELLSLKTAELISAGVYPYWHPSGKYIAYSVNQTQQSFHTHANERVEVFDHESDVIVYDIEQNRILTSPLLSTDGFETFPSFSPDGETLYFCCAEQRKLPEEAKEVRYNLCSIAFDSQRGAFGERIDTLVYASANQKSASIPRPSYDGKYIMYGLADYGSFFIWHNEADLWLLDLTSGEQRPLTEANSPFAESYHSWSSNSHWFVFASRRDDGLYTRLYLSSIDEEGKISKPFLLPQRNPAVNDPSFFSYNVPEFVSSPVKMDIREVERKILSDERKQAVISK
jgi:Periplasmic component of the Tol biopolymer transport system